MREGACLTMLAWERERERERERETYCMTLLKSKGSWLFHTLGIHTPFTSCIKCGHS